MNPEGKKHYGDLEAQLAEANKNLSEIRQDKGIPQESKRKLEADLLATIERIKSVLSRPFRDETIQDIAA